MRRAISTLTVLGLALLFAERTSAQAPPSLLEEHKMLKSMEGTWEATMKSPGSPDSKGMSVYKSICDGLWLVSDFEGDAGGFKFTGHGVDGYDASKKKFVQTWVDSMSGSLLNLEGDYDKEKKQLTMSGTGAGPDGSPMKVKNVTTYTDNDHMKFEMHMVMPDNTEMLVVTIEYTRVKNAAKAAPAAAAAPAKEKAKTKAKAK